MKKILLLILPILLIVAIAFTAFGIYQVRFEEEKLMDDIQRKTKSIAESMELSVKHILENSDKKSANYVVEKFQERERLQGCAIYDKEGKIIAITKRFADWGFRDSANSRKLLKDTIAHGSTEKYKDVSVYSYTLPITGDNGNFLGMVEIIYDTSYVNSRLGILWKRLSITLIISIVAIFLILLFIQRQLAQFAFFFFCERNIRLPFLKEIKPLRKTSYW